MVPNHVHEKIMIHLGRNSMGCCVWLLSCVQLFCNSMDCSLPGSSVHGIFWARILGWVAISFSRKSSRARDLTRVSCLAGRFFTTEPPVKTEESTKCSENPRAVRTGFLGEVRQAGLETLGWDLEESLGICISISIQRTHLCPGAGGRKVSAEGSAFCEASGSNRYVLLALDFEGPLSCYQVWKLFCNKV